MFSSCNTISAITDGAAVTRNNIEKEKGTPPPPPPRPPTPAFSSILFSKLQSSDDGLFHTKEHSLHINLKVSKVYSTMPYCIASFVMAWTRAGVLVSLGCFCFCFVLGVIDIGRLIIFNETMSLWRVWLRVSEMLSSRSLTKPSCLILARS